MLPHCPQSKKHVAQFSLIFLLHNPSPQRPATNEHSYIEEGERGGGERGGERGELPALVQLVPSPPHTVQLSSATTTGGGQVVVLFPQT
jgi:hypothetical protein